MSKTTWQKRLAVLRSRLYLYPAPDPLSRTPLFWIAMGLVSLMVLLFSGFFIAYAISRQDAFLTAAEDMGNMDQAVWSIIHGQILHQTICNVVSDTNCYSAAGFSRFAIHFEPMLFPVSLLYVIWSSPKTLLVLQTLIVASGAFPAFWLARLRLRNELAAVAIALVYLLYPAQQQATIFEFHAVTFTASLLLFTLYFMYTRRTVWLFVFAILSMACKEEIPLVIASFGLWSIIFQQRWRTGLGLVLLSIGWVGVALWAYRHFSPTGHPLLASRYAYLGNGPVEIIRNILLHPKSLISQHVLEQYHRKYLSILLAPVGYLPLLAPWILVLAVPSIAINLFSSDPNQYLGVFHYSAEIVPILIFATIEAIVVIIWAFQLFVNRIRERNEHEQNQPGEQSLASTRSLAHWLRPVMLIILIGFVLFNVVREDYPYGSLPFSRGFTWPQVTAHAALAQRFVDMIPASASVSAQSSLVPHLSERNSIYLFPYQDNQAQYIFLDITSVTYPYGINPYTTEVKKILLSGNYAVVAAQDGYLLLKKGLSSPTLSPFSPVQVGNEVIPDLPDDFCSFTRVSQQAITHPLQVDFSFNANSNTAVSLIGYSITPPSSFNIISPFFQVTTYWKVNTSSPPPLRVQALLIGKNGKQLYSSIDFPSLSWCPTSSWKPGTVFRTTSDTLWIGNMPNGLAHVAIALLPFAASFGTISSVTERLSLHIIAAPQVVTPVEGTNALQLDAIRIGP
ncbi:MAG TPA: DUF2079 domain-containing protein [Ktedonobacteraceae bacterium]